MIHLKKKQKLEVKWCKT